jgi:hypothetical protein
MLHNDSKLLEAGSENTFLGRGTVLFDRTDADGNSTGYLPIGIVDSLEVAVKTTVKTKEGGIKQVKTALKSVEIGPRDWTGKFNAVEWKKENILLAIGGEEATEKIIGDPGASADTNNTRVSLTGKCKNMGYGKWNQLIGADDKPLINLANYDYNTNAAITPIFTLGIPGSGQVITPTIGVDVDIDWENGLIRINTVNAGVPVNNETDLYVTCPCYSETLEVVSPATRPIRGKLLYVGTNEQQPRFRVEFWDVVLSSSADLKLIADDFDDLEFNMNIMSDETNHPTEPYFSMIKLGTSKLVTRSAQS